MLFAATKGRQINGNLTLSPNFREVSDSDTNVVNALQLGGFQQV